MQIKDGLAHIEQYRRQMSEADVDIGGTVFGAYKWSIASQSRDIKWDPSSYIYEGYAYKGDQFGNVTAAYSLTRQYGPAWANLMLYGASFFTTGEDIMQGENPIKMYLNYLARRHYQGIGINNAMRDASRERTTPKPFPEGFTEIDLTISNF